MDAIDVLHVVLPQALHQHGTTFVRLGGNQEMHVIRHQAVGMHCATGLRGKLIQEAQIGEMIRLREEAPSSVISALRDMNS
jgi:hypothetical protein